MIFIKIDLFQILHVPHLHTNLSDCDDVLDQLLDQARGGASKSNSGSHFSPHSLNSTCQQSEVSASCILYQGKNIFSWKKENIFGLPQSAQSTLFTTIKSIVSVVHVFGNLFYIYQRLQWNFINLLFIFLGYWHVYVLLHIFCVPQSDWICFC